MSRAQIVQFNFFRRKEEEEFVSAENGDFAQIEEPVKASTRLKEP